MNTEWVVRLTNRIAFITLHLLIFWILIFSVNTVFDLKIFRMHLTETFGLSILGILAILGGALMINLMLNMSRIADAKQGVIDSQMSTTDGLLRWKRQKYLLMMLLLAVFLVGGMFVADARTRWVKKNLMLNTAQQLAEQYHAPLTQFAQSNLDVKNVQEMANVVDLMGKSTEFVQRVQVIRLENIHGQQVPVAVGAQDGAARVTDANAQPELNPVDLVFRATKEQREYIEKVAQGQTVEPLYYSEGGQYWLMLPIKANGKNVILYTSDYQAYGKLGS